MIHDAFSHVTLIISFISLISCYPAKHDVFSKYIEYLPQSKKENKI